MSWFKREKVEGDKLAKVDESQKKVRTEGLWQKCEGCRQIIWKKDLEGNWNVCPKCGHHFRLDAAARVKMLLDSEVYQRFDADLRSSDPLEFVDKKPYRAKLHLPPVQQARRRDQRVR